MIILFILSIWVLQSGDTLMFLENSEIIEKIIMGEDIAGDGSNQVVIKQAKVSPNKQRYFVHESIQDIASDSLLRTKISFYDAENTVLYETSAVGDRSISYELSEIRNSLFIVTKWDEIYRNPTLDVIASGEKVEVIKDGEWQRIVSYKISPNDRYILFHTRKPYYGKPWDYIYFWDLKTGRNWDYIFPTCLSCKKSRIDVAVDDSGRAEVIHKKEHRIFSKEGVLVDIYTKM